MSLTRRVANAFTKRAIDLPTVYPSSSSYGIGYGGEGIRLDDVDREWTASAVAYRCVMAIAGNAASLPVQVRNTLDDTVMEGHWLPDLWENPNPTLSRRALAEVLWSRMETRGRTFVYVDRGESGTGRPTGLHPIPWRVEPVIDRDTATPSETSQIRTVLLGYRVWLPGGRRIGLLPSEVLWLRYPDPDTQWGSISPLGAAGHAVDLDAYAREWQRSEFKHGAKPRHVVYLGDLSPAQHDRAVQAWKSEVEGGSNAGKSLLLSGPTKSDVSRISLSAEEMSWLDTRHVAAEEVLLAFGVPKDYLMGGATYENRAAARTTLWSDTILPKLEIVASEMTRQLLADESQRRVRFDTDDVDALQEGADAKANRTTTLTGVDVYTLDEARAEMGLDPLPGGLGALTLSAYRTAVQMQAQAALLAGSVGSEDRRRALTLPGGVKGALESAPASAPFLIPARAGRRMHGPSKTTILREYDRHEGVILRAVSRLAKRQQAVVLTNADRLLKGRSKRAQAWLHDTATCRLALVSDDEAAQASARDALRASADDLFDVDHWTGETRIAMEGPVGGAWQAGAEQLAASLAIDYQKVDLLVLTAMDSRLDALSDQVTATTRQVLEDRVLLQGVANGESIDQLRARIRSVFSDLSSWRGTMIARTETVGGYNRASLTVAEGSGVVVAREWSATDDARTRDSHNRVDGEVVRGFDKRYGNGCLHPGDPTARPEETILCRCVELYETED